MLGILSLVFWSLLATLVIVVKYVTFVLRADNCGEGGTMALLALVDSADSLEKKRRLRQVLGGLALFGASFYGDGIITPAISVFPPSRASRSRPTRSHDFVVPVTVAIIIGLFSFQKRGTASVGKIFGPATLVWSAPSPPRACRIFRNPGVLAALNPPTRCTSSSTTAYHGFVLGSVVLCVTGGEALYADMGHFGRAPIRAAWYAVVMPSPSLSYFGQGALLEPHQRQPFFPDGADLGGVPDGGHRHGGHGGRFRRR
ncbi:MAG: KUP/HAK/KT family potassium transporter [Polyangiales bacterium]